MFSVFGAFCFCSVSVWSVLVTWQLTTTFHPPTLYSRRFDFFDVYDFLNSADEGYTCLDHCVMSKKKLTGLTNVIKVCEVMLSEKNIQGLSVSG